MKHLRLILSTVLLAAASLSAFAPAEAKASADRQERKLLRDQRKREREEKAVQKATVATEQSVKEGKTPLYSRLLKSTDYETMYTEGLRYYHATKKGKDYNSQRNYQRAQNLFSEVVRMQPFAGTPRQDSLIYYFGSSFYKAGDFDLSEQVFDRFRRDFPGSVFMEDAEYMYAMGFYFSSPEPELDQTLTRRAIDAINEYEGRYPNTTKRKECEERLLELRRKLYAKSFESAKLYYDIGQYRAAVRAINNAISEYPSSPYREELLYLATRASYLLARNSITSLQTDRYLSMMDGYYNLVAEFPQTRFLRDAERMRDEARQHIDAHTKQLEEVTATENGN